MTHSKMISWIAVLDGREARFYSKEPGNPSLIFHHSLQAKPIRTETPTGRGELGRSFDSMGQGRHIIEPHTSDRTQEYQLFMRDIAHYLDEALEKKRYQRLVITTSPKTLGLLRKELSKAVKETISLELDKDLIKYTPEHIQQQIEELVQL